MNLESNPTQGVESLFSRLRPPHLLSLLPILFVLIGLGRLSGGLQALDWLDSSIVIVMLSGLVLLVTATILHARLPHPLISAFMHFAVSLVWMILGLPSAMWVMLIGIAVGSWLYYLRGTRLGGMPWTPATAVEQVLRQIAIVGVSAMVSFGAYILMGGDIPVQTMSIEHVFPIGFALLSGFICKQLFSFAFDEANVWKPLDLVNLALELGLLVVVASLPTLLAQAGQMTFLIFVTFVGLQVVRYYQAQIARQLARKQIQELSAINAVGRNVTAHLSLQDVLMSIYQEVHQLIPADTIFIALADDDEETLHYRLVMQNEQAQTWDTSHAKSPTHYVNHEQTPLLIQRGEAQRLNQLNINMNGTAGDVYLGVPLLVGDTSLGVVGAVDNNPQTLTPDALQTLEHIATQASLAVRNATLYEQTTQSAEHLSRINQSIQDVIFNLDYQEAIQVACQTALDLTDAQASALMLVDNQDKRFIHLNKSLHLPVDLQVALEKIPYQAERYTAGAFTVENVAQSADSFSKILQETGGYCAFTEVPLRSGNTVIGYMLVLHEGTHRYSELELDLLAMLTSQVTVALDNADLLQALELYASEQAQLVHLSSIMGANLELDRILGDVITIIKQMLDLPYVEIGLVSQSRDKLDVYAFDTESPADLNIVREYQVSDYPDIAATIQNVSNESSIFLLDDTNLSEPIRELMGQADLEMLTVMPMVVQNEVIAMIFLGDHTSRLFKDSERRLIDMATSQVATQIHNAQIHNLTEEALVQRLEQLALIEDIAQQISRSHDLDLIIGNVLDSALRSTQADIALIALKADDGDGYRILVKQGLGSPYEETRMATTGVIGDVVKTKRIRIIPDNRDVRNYVSPDPDKEFLSSMAVPLLQGDEVIGVLNVESHELEFFTDEQSGFIKSLAGHAMISIQNARFLQERQEQIETLTQLRTLALQTSTEVDQQRVIEAVLENSLQMLEAHRSALFSYDDEDDLIRFENGIVQLGSRVVGDQFFVPDSLVYQVAHSQSLQTYEDISQLSRFETYEHRQLVDYESLLLIPIRWQGMVRHVLCLAFKHRTMFTQSFMDKIDLLMVQTAGHLENATLTKELRTSNLRMRAILDSTRDGIILLDREGTLQDVNISAEQLIGIELSEHLDKHFATTLLDYTKPADDARSTLENEGLDALIQMARILRTDPQRTMIREYILRPHGKPVYIKEISSPVRDARNDIIGRLLSLRDQTEEKSLEVYRDKLQNMLLHDLKSPLAAIISSMVLGKDIADETNTDNMDENIPLISEMFTVAFESGSNLYDLVGSLLDIAKLQQQKMELEPKSHDLKEIAEKAYTALSASFKDADIQIEYDTEANMKPVYVDGVMVRRVFTNLMQNALEHTPKGGTIRISTDSKTSRADFIRVMISDTGMGIPAENREKIFGEFEQIENQPKERGGKGSGLGLTFCKLSVEAHGGRIWVEANGPLSGATIAFTLPIVPQ